MKPLLQNAITHRLNRFRYAQSTLYNVITRMQDPLGDVNRNRLLLETSAAIWQAFGSKYGPLPMVEFKEIEIAWRHITHCLEAGRCCVCESREPILLRRIQQKVSTYCKIDRGHDEQSVADSKECYQHHLATLYAVARVLSDAVVRKLSPQSAQPQLNIAELYATLAEGGATLD